MTTTNGASLIEREKAEYDAGVPAESCGHLYIIGRNIDLAECFFGHGKRACGTECLRAARIHMHIWSDWIVGHETRENLRNRLEAAIYKHCPEVAEEELTPA